MPISKEITAQGAAFLIGSMVALAELLFFAFRPHFQTPDALWLLLICPSPAFYLAGSFVDVQPTTDLIIIVGTPIVLLNGLVYASVATVFLRLRAWIDDSARSTGRA